MGPLLDWLVVALWAAALWGVSSVPGAALPLGLDNNEPLRNVGHWLGFALLGALAYRAAGSTLRRWGRTTAAACAFCIGCGYALIDEWHQAFVPGRAWMLDDLAVDVLGTVVGLAAAVVTARLQARREWMRLAGHPSTAACAQRAGGGDAGDDTEE